jgi:NADH:ubiquinone oxidoreductase subunit F (NADH-binding)
MSIVQLPQPHGAGRPRSALIPLATPRLLAGPPLDGAAEAYDAHCARLGPRPRGGAWLLDVIDRSGLRGRGGAWFPTGRKWRGVAAAAAGRPGTVLVNASEGEPLSAKDASLVLHRPHLIIDGAHMAAESVAASEVLIYLSRPSRQATRALHEALRERRRAGLRELPVRLVHSAHRYVAGESSAAVRRASGDVAKPRFAPPHPSESGVDGRPTLVQNAESIAHVAMIGRRGDSWFRERGPQEAPGTMLITLSGDVRYPGVYEVDVGTRLTDTFAVAGGTLSAPSGVLLGGYFGCWANAWALDAIRLTPSRVALGCGVVGVLAADACPLSEAARIATYLAAESAGQCGPCVFGLRAIAETMARIVAGDAELGDPARLERWSAMVAGRGACRHPDGAINNVRTALQAFGDDLARHLDGRPCSGRGRASLPPPPSRHRGWR